MAGHKVKVIRGTILQEEVESMSRLGAELRAGKGTLKVAAEILKLPPDRNRMDAMQRLAIAAGGDTLIPLLDADAKPHYVRQMTLESMLIDHMMKSSPYGGISLRQHAERHLRSLQRDLRGIPDSDVEMTPLKVIIGEGCLDSNRQAENAAREARLRVEKAMLGMILSECPDLIIVRGYLADAVIEGYGNIEL